MIWSRIINQAFLKCSSCGYLISGSVRVRQIRTWMKLGSQSLRAIPPRPAATVTIGGFSLAFLGLFEKEDTTPEDKIVLYIKKAILAMQQDDHASAEENLAQAFHLCRKHGLQDALTQVVDYQANLALKRGYLSRAEALFKFLSQRLLNLKKATATDNSFVEISLKLAEIYMQTGRLEEAMSGFQHCAVAQRQKIDSGAEDEDTLVLAAWSLHDLSQVYIRLGLPDKKDDLHLSRAVHCLREAYSYVFKALGPEAQQSVAIKSDLATALALQGKHATALKIFKEIGEIAREKHTDLYPGIKVNVGNVHLQKSEFEQANKICLEARNLAMEFKDMDALRRAEECVLKSLGGQKKVEAAVG